MCFDGQFMLTLINMLQNNKDADAPDHFESSRDTWKHLYPEARKYAKPLVGFTKILPKDQKKLALDSNTRFIYTESEAEDLQCCDKENNHLHAFLESLWTSAILSAFAYNRSFGDVCLSTMIGTRKFLSEDLLTRPDQASSIPVRGYCNENTTVEELGNSMRKDLNEQNKLPQVFAYIADLVPELEKRAAPPPTKPDTPPQQDGVLMEISSIGKFTLKNPFEDVWASLTMTSPTTLGAVAILSYSVQTEKRFHVNNGFRYCSEKFADDDAYVFINSVKYAMENINKEMKCGDAVQKIIEFQNKIMK